MNNNTNVSRRSTSGTSAPSKTRLAAVAVKEMLALQQEARLLNPSGNQPKWSAVFRAHWVDYVTLAVLMTLWLIMEDMHPYTRVLYFKTDAQLWRYSYPLRPNTVPPLAVPALAVGGPLVIFIVYYFAFRCSRVEFHNLTLGLLSAVFVTASVVNFVKLNVGRPRPHFVARCWPSAEPRFDANGMPDCVGGVHSVAEGLKSFPSGHTAWSASGLGFLGFFLLGKSKAFDGSAHPTRLIAGLLPMVVALWIALTRMQDYWHHWEDVVAGYLLGLTVAYCFYRSLYPPLTSSRADVPMLEYHTRHHADHSKAYGHHMDARAREKRTSFTEPGSTRGRGEGTEITEATPLIATNV